LSISAPPAKAYVDGSPNHLAWLREEGTMSVQIVHCSDLHLDRNFNVGSIARNYERKRDLDANFIEIVNYAIENRSDLFLISGDVFDRVNPGNFSRDFLARQLKKLNAHGIPVFIIGGNHDVPKVPEVPTLALDVLDTVGLATVFSRSDLMMQRTLQIAGLKVCISGKSYFSQREGENPIAGQRVPLDGDVNILMLHGSLQGLDVVSSVPQLSSQNPFAPEDIPRKLDFLALGHFHNGFDRRVGRCLVCNPGSIEKLTWAEINDSKGFYWVELDREGSESEFVRLGTRPMRDEQFAFTGEEVDDPTSAILEFLMGKKDNQAMLRLKLSGLIPQATYSRLRLGDIYRAGPEAFFFLTVDRSELEISRIGRVFAGRTQTPAEAFIARMDALIGDSASDPKKAELLREAKEVGLRYLVGEP
jgi:DNA repair exonuclease SbcCD nuclease subunit